MSKYSLRLYVTPCCFSLYHLSKNRDIGQKCCDWVMYLLLPTVFGIVHVIFIHPCVIGIDGVLPRGQNFISISFFRTCSYDAHLNRIVHDPKLKLVPEPTTPQPRRKVSCHQYTHRHDHSVLYLLQCLFNNHFLQVCLDRNKLIKVLTRPVGMKE